MKGTSKQQFRVLLAISKTSEESGKSVDLDELIESLTPPPTKEAIQFVIRALIRKSLIEKTTPELRRKRQRACFQLTNNGKISLDPTNRTYLEIPESSFDSGNDFLLEMEEIEITVE